MAFGAVVVNAWVVLCMRLRDVRMDDSIAAADGTRLMVLVQLAYR